MARRMTESEAIEKMNNVLPDHIKFVGWANNGGIYDCSKRAIVKLHCNKHNKDFTLWFYYLTTLDKDNIGCSECLEMSKRMGIGISKSKNGEEKALEIINNLLPSHIKFLGWERDWISIRKTTAKFFCTLHNEEFTIKCRNLREHKTIKCLKCFVGSVVDQIKDLINFKNENLGTKLEFLGFVGEYTNYNNTKILLKCNIHNKTFESSIPNFINNVLNLSCPECLVGSKNHSSVSEKFCYTLIKKYCDKKIELQYLFKTYDKICKKSRKIYVDFYIKELNLIIEYDGAQHFKFNKYYHRDNYKTYINQVNRDKCLNEYCKSNSIKLLRISYKDNNRLEEIIKAYFEEGKDITTKVDPILLPIKYEGGTKNG